MGKSILSLIFLFIILVTAQVVIFNNICLFNIAIPIIFIYFIIRLPISININLVMTIAFITGLIIDIFSDTQGVHALSCTITSFVKRDILRLYITREDDVSDDEITIKSIGFSAYFKYLLTIVLLYCTLIFCIEAFTFFNIMQIILRIICSTILSFLLILGLERIINSRREKRL